MLTRRGWTVTVGAVLLVVAGRLLGALELYVLAAGALALCALAWIAVLSGASGLDVERRVVPPRTHAGADAQVELAVTNRSRRRTPPVLMVDAFNRAAGERGGRDEARRPVRFQLAPLAPGSREVARYRVPTERGLFRIGPVELTVADPFGLACRLRSLGSTTELTVYPRVEPVAPPPSVARDPRGGSQARAAVGAGDEFYGLRPYQIGDDLRRVHWPSTARQNDLMIRQPEQPWQGRATILLDTRHPSPPGAEPVAPKAALRAFEAAVSAAASIVTECWHHDAQVRLATTSGFDSGPGSGPRHLEGLLEHLAVVTLGSDEAAAVTSALGRHGSGALVVLSAAPPGAGHAAHLPNLASVAARYGWSALVLVGPAADGPAPPGARGVHVVRADASRPFGPSWNRAVRLELAT